jgi:hypothetical protein
MSHICARWGNRPFRWMGPSDVRFWHFADIDADADQVRSQGMERTPRIGDLGSAIDPKRSLAWMRLRSANSASNRNWLYRPRCGYDHQRKLNPTTGPYMTRSRLFRLGPLSLP